MPRSNYCAAFQQLEVDYFLGEPHEQVLRTELSEVPILRMYGVSESGDVFSQLHCAIGKRKGQWWYATD